MSRPHWAPPAVEHEITLPLDRVRYVGTYQDLGDLINRLHAIVLQVTQQEQPGRLFISLAERGKNTTVRDLTELPKITSRRIADLRLLSVAIRVTPYEEPNLNLSFFIDRDSLRGSVTGSDEAPVRAIRASVNDLLHGVDRGPGWLSSALITGVGVFFWAASTALSFTDVIGLGALGGYAIAGALFAHHLYYPQVELIEEGERTRWERWSKTVVVWAVAWLLGSLAYPIFAK